MTCKTDVQLPYCQVAVRHFTNKKNPITVYNIVVNKSTDQKVKKIIVLVFLIQKPIKPASKQKARTKKWDFALFVFELYLTVHTSRVVPEPCRLMICYVIVSLTVMVSSTALLRSQKLTTSVESFLELYITKNSSFTNFNFRNTFYFNGKVRPRFGSSVIL